MATANMDDPQIQLLFQTAKTGRLDDFKTTLYASKKRLSIQDGVGNTPLHYAAASNHLDVVKFILRTDRKVINIRNNIGETALHKAAARKAGTQVIQALLDGGADTLVKTDEGFRAQDLAKDNDIKTLLTPKSLESYSDDDDMDPFADDSSEDPDEEENQDE